MSLREEVAKQLRSASGATGEWASFEQPYWLKLADECIRQAKWQLRAAGEAARVIGPEAKEVPPAIWEQWAHIIETGPVTLAPPDWKP